MRPQAPAVFAIDDRAASRAGVAFVRYDQLQRVSEQFDMLVIDRSDASLVRADEADRIVTSADAGLEHSEVASALLEVEAGQCEQRFEQSGHAREADAVAVFRQVEHYSSPMAEKV